MSNYNSLKATINANVKTNNNQEITGSVMNSVLNAMVTTMGAGYQYIGVATPSTDPDTPDARVFYIAATPGTYTNFGGLVINDGEVAILKWDTAWHKDLTGAATAAQVSQLGQFVWPGNIRYSNLAVRELYLQDSVSGEQYYVFTIVKNSTSSAAGLTSNGYGIAICTKNNGVYTVVAAGSNLAASKDDVIVLSERNNSGISGYCLIKWEEVYADGNWDGDHPEILKNAFDIHFSPLISNYLYTLPNNSITTEKIVDDNVTITKIADYAKLPVLSGYLGGSSQDYNSSILEIYINPNYLTNVADIGVRKYSGGYIIRAFDSNYHTLWTIRKYNISYVDYEVIPLVVTNAGGSASVDDVVGYLIFKNILAFLTLPDDLGDGQKIVLRKATKLFANPSVQNYIDGRLFSIPNGTITTQKLANGAVSFQKTTGVSPYEGVYISIPSTINAVVGDKIQIFFKSIVNCADITAFDVIAVCSKGKSYHRYWEYTPVAGDAGNSTTITIRVRDNALNTIVEKSATISFVNKMTAPGTNKNVLCIGASATANGVWVGELKRRLTENTGDGTPANPTGLGLSNITFVGRKQGSAVNVPLEATGGWKVQTYASQGETAFRMQVSGVTQLYIGDTYTSSNGGVFVLQEINVTGGVGNLRFTFNSPVPTIPASGTLTRTSGTGDSTISYSSYTEETYSPFWNTNTNKLDFTTYANDWCSGSIDIMIWHCGVNDIFPGTEASITAAIDAFKDILRQFHIDFPSGKVIISSVPTCSQNGGMAANYGASSYANTFTFSNSARQYALALSALCADAEFSSFAFYASVLEEFDSENNYPSIDTPVNNRLTSVTEKVGTNGVHPLDVGSLQVADGVYRAFNTI